MTQLFKLEPQVLPTPVNHDHYIFSPRLDDTTPPLKVNGQMPDREVQL